MSKTYSIAIASRLKRRIFLAGNIPSEFLRLAKAALNENLISIQQYRFYDYGVLLQLNMPDEMSPETAAALIRSSTSKPLRTTFSELWPLPSLWTRKCFIKAGELDGLFVQEAEDFFASLKNR